MVQSSHLEHREEAIATAFCYCAGTHMGFFFFLHLSTLMASLGKLKKENPDFFLLEKADKERQTRGGRKHVPQSSASMPDSQN